MVDMVDCLMDLSRFIWMVDGFFLRIFIWIYRGLLVDVYMTMIIRNSMSRIIYWMAGSPSNIFRKLGFDNQKLEEKNTISQTKKQFVGYHGSITWI